MGRHLWARLAALLLPAMVRAAAVTGLQCYSNGNGRDPPSLTVSKVYCAPNEQCVAENHGRSATAAALWPLDATGEKCYRFCQKVTVDSTWGASYQDSEETIRVYSRDNAYVLKMTCNMPLCNQACPDEDSAAGLAPSALVMVLSLLLSFLASWGG